MVDATAFQVAGRNYSGPLGEREAEFGGAADEVAQSCQHRAALFAAT